MPAIRTGPAIGAMPAPGSLDASDTNRSGYWRHAGPGFAGCQRYEPNRSSRTPRVIGLMAPAMEPFPALVVPAWSPGTGPPASSAGTGGETCKGGLRGARARAVGGPQRAGVMPQSKRRTGFRFRSTPVWRTNAGWPSTTAHMADAIHMPAAEFRRRVLPANRLPGACGGRTRLKISAARPCPGRPPTRSCRAGRSWLRRGGTA